MKRLHIIGLIFIAGVIALLVSFSGNLTTYDTFTSAKAKKGRYVHLITTLNRNYPITYDPVKNPNYFIFYASDTAGVTSKVVYQNVKPADFEKSVQIVLKGAMQEDYFNCKEILLKCPSKYKDDKTKLNETLSAR